MKKRKRLISLLLSAVLILSLTCQGVAAEMRVTRSACSPTLAAYIIPMYQGQLRAYAVMGKDGKHCTNQFYRDTLASFSKNDLGSIYDYYSQAVSCMVYMAVSEDAAACSGDVSKTVIKTYIYGPLFPSDAGRGVAATMDFKQAATIYYNPNTGVISSASSYYYDFRLYPDYAVIAATTDYNASYDANRYSVTVGNSVHLIAESFVGVKQADYGHFPNYITLTGN